jgi:hypothetical protein
MSAEATYFDRCYISAPEGDKSVNPLSNGQRRSDLEALGDEAPDGAILGAWVEHLVAKEALLANDQDVFFTTPHFDGYAIVLVRLDEFPAGDLDEVIVEAWLARAPKRLVEEYMSRRPD